jgi:signal peptidase I
VDSEFDFEKRYRLFREIIETIVLTVLMFLIIRLAVQNFNIDGMSMEPSLHNQELILVDKWSYLFHAPARGDVIVFVAPPNPAQDYIKRVVGLPGDVITVQNTDVYVNGKKLTEAYVEPHHQGNPYPSFTNRVVPQGAYFVMGDNRGGSSDSRDWGCVPQKNLIGRAAVVYWPLAQDNNGLLPNFSSVFTSVPSPAGVTTKDVCPIIHNPQVGTTSPGDTTPFNTMALLVVVLPGMFVGWRRRHEWKRS